MSAVALRQSLASVRSRVRIEEAEARRMGAAYITAAVIGVTSKPNDAGEVPITKLAFWGMPGTATVAVAAKGAAAFASGDLADYLNGIGDAAAIVAISNFVQGREVAGVATQGRTRAEVERNLRARLSQGGMPEEDIDAELSALAGY